MLRDVALDKAKQAVSSRPSSYGSPKDNFDRIALLWNAHLNNTSDEGSDRTVYFDTSDVAIMLGLVKIARLESNPNHADSWIDLAGYAGCGAEVSQAETPAGHIVSVDYVTFETARRNGEQTSAFGFTIGETVNLKIAAHGSLPGVVVGFHCQYIKVRWPGYEGNNGALNEPGILRHGI